MSVGNTQQTNVGKLGAIPRVTPRGLQYPVAQMSPAGRRRIIRLSPDQPNGYTITTGGTSNLTRFYLPNADILDFTAGGLAFDLTLSAQNPGTYIRHRQHVSSIINRVRIRTVGELEDVRGYNQIYSIIKELYREPLVGAVTGEITGFGTKFERNTWGATADKDYLIELFCGLFLSSPSQ